MKFRDSPKITPEDLSDSYDKIFEGSHRLRDTDSFYRWILKKLNPIAHQRLLDIGCGEGILVDFAHKLGLISIGMDISASGIKIAQLGTGSKRFALANGENLPFGENSFDYITNIGSLEHFINPLTGVREMRRVLHPDGLAAIVLPNGYYLADIIWNIWRTGYSVSHQQPLERFAAFGEWRDFLESGGLKIVKTYKYNFCFPKALNDLHWYRDHPRRILNLLLSPITPFNLSYHFLYLCKK